MTRELRTAEMATLTAGSSTTLQMRVILPPEVTNIARGSGTGTYYDSASGGNRFYL